MSNAKIVAIVSILFLVTIPLFAVSADGDNDLSATKTITIGDDKLKGNDYWVRVTGSYEEGFTIKNNTDFESKKQCIVELDYCENNEYVVTIKGEFTIPSECGIIDTGVDGVSFVDATMTVKGYYEDTSRGKVDLSSAEPTYPMSMENSKIIVDGGYFSPVTIFIDEESSIEVKNSGKIGSMIITVMNDGSLNLSPNIRLSNITTSGDEKGGFKISVGKEYALIVEGMLIGTSGSDSLLSLGRSLWATDFSRGSSAEMMNIVFKNVDLHNLIVDGCANNVLLTIYSDNQVLNTVGNNVLFITGSELSPGYYLQDRIVSGKGEIFVSVQCAYYEKHREETMKAGLSESNAQTVIPSDIYCAEFGEKGLIDQFVYVNVRGTEGIDGIKTNFKYDVGDGNLFVTAGQPYDLGTIDVKCASGYSFDGFYYLNDAGVEVKITDPANFTAYDNMTIYAKATADQPSYNAYFIAIIAILVIVAILGFAYMILRDRGVIGGYY